MSSSTNQVSNSSSKILKSKIEKVIFGGAGLFREKGCVVFVPFAAPGDELHVRVTRVKKDYKIARIEKIIKKSPDRTAPRCPYFQSCGGCQLQHLKPLSQLRVKQTFLEEMFGFKPDITPSPHSWHYRSHLRFNLENGTFGFKGTDNCSLIPVESCSLFLPLDHPLFKKLRLALQPLKEKGSFRLFKGKDAAFILAFSFPKKLPKNRRAFIKNMRKALPIQGIAMKSPHGEEHDGNTTIQETLCGLNISFSPYGFIQNNPSLIETLYETLVSLANPQGKTILDLYSGVGVTSLLLAQAGAQVTAVEESLAAVKCAKLNQKQNGVTGVTFLHKRAETALSEALTGRYCHSQSPSYRPF